jgi:hypothetical protein
MIKKYVPIEAYVPPSKRICKVSPQKQVCQKKKVISLRNAGLDIGGVHPVEMILQYHFLTTEEVECIKVFNLLTKVVIKN